MIVLLTVKRVVAVLAALDFWDLADFVDLTDLVVTVVSSRPIDSSVNGRGPGNFHYNMYIMWDS